MKLVKPSYEILTPIDGEAILKSIEKAARTCYKSEEKISDDGKSATELVMKLLARGHGAMIEFGTDIAVKFVCDRGVSHELVRHRLASFAQESTRYCNYGKDEHIQFIIPSWEHFKEKSYLIEWDNLHGTCTNAPMDGAGWWFWHMAVSERDYNKLIESGWSPQQARSVLPNSLKTEINVKANLREWRHIFQQRVAAVAHPQMRELMRPLLDEFKKKIPLIFDDIVY